MKHQDALALLARETKRARQNLALERVMRAGLWLAVAVGFWAVLALSGAYELLPLLAQSVLAMAALVFFGWLASRAVRAWRRPTEAEARARLAFDSKLDPGAFEALGDRPSRFDAFSVALWKREQEEAFHRAERARAGPARPRLDDIDQFKLRYIIAAVLAITLVLAGAERWDRLSRAFLPDPGPLVGDGPLQVEAWATPADYTHAPPVSLSDRLGERIETPPSITATVRVTGPRGAPRLVFVGRAGDHHDVRFVRAADGAWEAHIDVPYPGRLKIVRFHTVASWQMAPAEDLAPTAQLTAPLAALPQERVTFAWRATDDYGVSTMWLRVRPLHPPPGLVNTAPIDTPIEAPAGDPQEANGEATIDLAEHPYAGMEVLASVVATDAGHHSGESAAVRFVMPEKVFLQPLARAAIEIRRDILWERRPYRGAPHTERRTVPAGDIVLGRQRIEVRDYLRRNDIGRAPPGIRHSATLLDALTMAPEDGYFRDLAVFLGLRRARSELNVAQNVAETDEAADILWRTALRAEYGGAADARLALEQAQQALAEALANGASQERIQQLMQALRDATSRYLQAMVQQAIRDGERAPQDTQDQAQISQQDIQDLLQQVQRLAEQGRTQEAQQLLQMLANILSHLDAQMDEGGEGQQGGEGHSDQQMQQSMDNLSDTIGQQRALRDETQQQGDQPPQQQQQNAQQQQQQSAAGGSGGNQQGGEGGDDLADRQGQLQQSLSQAQHQADQAGAEPSADLNAAGQAMRQAENALRRGDFSAAQSAQNTALDHLREGADQLAAQIRANAQRRSGASRPGGAADPLGRDTGGSGVGEGNTPVPTNIDPARAREIFNEIRRRAEDPNRPEAEREYLRRLMERFSGS